MAGEQIEASTSTCTVATTRSATVRYRTVPGEVYEASKDYCTVRVLKHKRTTACRALSCSLRSQLSCLLAAALPSRRCHITLASSDLPCNRVTPSYHSPQATLCSLSSPFLCPSHEPSLASASSCFNRSRTLSRMIHCAYSIARRQMLSHLQHSP